MVQEVTDGSRYCARIEDVVGIEETKYLAGRGRKSFVQSVGRPSVLLKDGAGESRLVAFDQLTDYHQSNQDQQRYIRCLDSPDRARTESFAPDNRPG